LKKWKKKMNSQVEKVEKGIVYSPKYDTYYVYVGFGKNRLVSAPTLEIAQDIKKEYLREVRKKKIEQQRANFNKEIAKLTLDNDYSLLEYPNNIVKVLNWDLKDLALVLKNYDNNIVKLFAVLIDCLMEDEERVMFAFFLEKYSMNFIATLEKLSTPTISKMIKTILANLDFEFKKLVANEKIIQEQTDYYILQESLRVEARENLKQRLEGLTDSELNEIVDKVLENIDLETIHEKAKDLWKKEKI